MKLDPSSRYPTGMHLATSYREPTDRYGSFEWENICSAVLDVTVNQDRRVLEMVQYLTGSGLNINKKLRIGFNNLPV